MLDLTQLNDAEYVMKNIFDIYSTHKELWKIIEAFKEQIKINWQSYETETWTIKYIRSSKLVPTDWEALMQAYPIEQYKEIYDIRLSAKAGDVITDETLVHYEPIESTRFTLVNSIDEHKSNNTWEILDV